MADILKVTKNRKKSLPRGWVERISRKHPDLPFYFNEDTGETVWSPPIDSVDKEGRKSKKRKCADVQDGAASDTSTCSIGQKLLAALRPKLKAKKTLNSDESDPDRSNTVDTPAMRQYREKLAQRKEAQEAKRNTPKKLVQRQSVTPALDTSKRSTRSSRRSSSAASSNASECSDASNVSCSSMGTIIKAAASSIKAPQKVNSETSSINKLPKIPKVKLDKTRVTTSQSRLSDVNEDDLSSENECNKKTPQGKNQAHERLKNFRKSLNTEDVKSPSSKRVKDCNENAVEKRCNLAIKSKKTESSDANQQARRVLGKYEDEYCEEMEWEPIEVEKITSEVYSVRFQLCEQAKDRLSELSRNALQSVENQRTDNAFYIVVDTNVFLSNLPFIEEVRDSCFEKFGRPFIVIPWTVLQELDFIKDNKNLSKSQALKEKARKAVDFLNQHFTAKHPRFLGQTPSEVERNKKKFVTECPDDEILQTCLQIKDSSKTPVLLTYDKNLCNKAIIHDISTLGRGEPLEKIFNLKAAETEVFLTNSLHAHMEEKNEESGSLVENELLVAEDLMEEGKAVLKVLLSEIVAIEMKNLFGEKWEPHVIIRPPWSINTVFKCALKHWMGAVNEAFTTRKTTELLLRELQTYIQNIPEGGRKLLDVKFFLDKCNDVIQMVKNESYHELKSKITEKMDELRKRCIDSISKLNDAKIKDFVGSEEDSEQAKVRASLAFKVFEEIYAFARDICGIASESLGLQCAFTYNKFHPIINTKIALEEQHKVGVSTNALLLTLESTLNKMDQGMLNDRVILVLYEVLVNFSNSLQFNELMKLTPLDIFCCLRLKRPKLEKGYEQLQELAMHFRRIANFQCK